MTLLALCLGMSAAFARELPERDTFELLDFRGGALFVYEGPGQYVFSGTLNWVPRINLTPWWFFRASAGVFPLKGSTGFFAATDLELLVGFALDGGELELGGGFQDWTGTNNGGNSPVASANLIIPIKKGAVPILDHVFLGYTMYFGSVSWFYETKLGVGVAF